MKSIMWRNAMQKKTTPKKLLDGVTIVLFPIKQAPAIDEPPR